VVLASDVPPATLPQGFLEQLPLLESFKVQEFESFLQFVQQQILQQQQRAKPIPTAKSPVPKTRPDNNQSTDDTYKEEGYDALPMDDPLSKRRSESPIKAV